MPVSGIVKPNLTKDEKKALQFAGKVFLDLPQAAGDTHGAGEDGQRRLKSTRG